MSTTANDALSIAQTRQAKNARGQRTSRTYWHCCLSTRIHIVYHAKMGQTVRTVKRVKLLRTCEADENADLEAKRRQNEIRLRGTFEAIFEKYARDFTGIGDEVNMETGTVEVDNGHLRGMRHERDILTREACILTGKTPSRAVDVNDGYEDELSTPFPPVSCLNL